MKNNKTIEEIRKVREEISRKCDYDPKNLIEYYMNRQEKRESSKKKHEQTH